MSFDEWLAKQPFRNVLFQGTINMMRKAWEAGQSQLIPLAGMTDRELESSVRMRGDIHD